MRARATGWHLRKPKAFPQARRDTSAVRSAGGDRVRGPAAAASSRQGLRTARVDEAVIAAIALRHRIIGPVPGAPRRMSLTSAGIGLYRSGRLINLVQG